jgi:signal peptidase II
MWFWVPLLAALIVVFDQWTKNWIRSNIPLNGVLVPIPSLEPYLRLVHWNNTGAAFGIFQGQANIFIAIAVIVIVVVLIYLRQLPADQWTVRLCLGFQLGGATGNLIDRIMFQHVTDFISVGNFAVFNVADASISVGVAILILGVWLKERAEKKKAAQAELVKEEMKSE